MSSPISMHDLLAHERFVRSLVRQLIRDPELGEDIVQETWLAALEHPPRSRVSLRSWLAAVARNAAFGRGRAKERRVGRERAVARPERVVATDELAARLEVQRRLAEAVLDLEEHYRSVILLRFYEGLPPREIARRLEIPVATVRTRIRRALALLRDRLDQGHPGGRTSWLGVLMPWLEESPRLARRSLALASTLGGALAVTKLKVGMVSVVLAALGWWALSSFDRDPASPDSVSVTPKPLADPPLAPSNSMQARPVATTDAEPTQITGEPSEASGEQSAVEESTAGVTGLILDRAGLPIAEAEAALEMHLEDTEWVPVDGSGRFHITGLPIKRPMHFHFEIRAPGYVQRRISLGAALIDRVPEPGSLVDLGPLHLETLEVESLEVLVLDETSEPIGGAEAFALRSRVAPAWSDWPPPKKRTEARGKTDLDGIARLALPRTSANGAWWINTSAEGFGWRPWRQLSDGELSTGTKLALVLPREGIISGRVLTLEGRPVADAWIAATSRELKRQVRSDDDGRFRIDRLPRLGSFRVRCSAWGYLAPDGRYRIERRGVEVNSKAMELRLRKRHRFELTVDLRDAAGDPIDWEILDGEIEVQDSEEREVGIVVDLQPGEEPGRLVGYGFGTGTFRLEASCHGYRTTRSELIHVDDRSRTVGPLSLLFEREPRIRIELIDDRTRDALQMTRAMWFSLDPTLLEPWRQWRGSDPPRLLEFRHPLKGIDAKPLGSFDQERALAGLHTAAGAFDFAGLEYGTYLFGVAASGYPVQTIGPIELTPARPHATVRAMLPAGRRLSGRLRFPDGTPAPYAQLWLIGPNGVSKYVRADAQGHYDADPLAPGDYWAYAKPWVVGDEVRQGSHSGWDMSGEDPPDDSIWNFSMPAQQEVTHDWMIEDRWSASLEVRIPPSSSSRRASLVARIGPILKLFQPDVEAVQGETVISFRNLPGADFTLRIDGERKITLQPGEHRVLQWE